MSSPTPEQITVLLRPCPTCGAVEAEMCKNAAGRHITNGFTHKARSVPTRVEQQKARQAEYTARYRRRKAAKARTVEAKRTRREGR